VRAPGYLSRFIMKDLTEGSIACHITTMAAQIAANLLAQIACQLVDLYFVVQLGVAATAGVNAAGNLLLIVGALVQVLTAGTLAVISNAIGRRDFKHANVAFNQAMVLSLAFGIVLVAAAHTVPRLYLRSISADADTTNAGLLFVAAALPAYVLAFPMAVLSSALRGAGIVQPSTIAYVLTVLLNTLLAPILIAGWGTGVPLGVRGAGLATSISAVGGIVVLSVYFHRCQKELVLTPALLRPIRAYWRRMLAIGLPAGGELVSMFLYMALVYYVTRELGAATQAGFGIGYRVLQIALMPGMIVALAASAIVGQNQGAGKHQRVSETLRRTLLIECGLMLAVMVVVASQARRLVSIFAADTHSTEIAVQFLHWTSWSFVAQGLVYACSSMFQGLGNTVPSLISSGVRLLAFAVPAIWISSYPQFRIDHVWSIWLFAVALQAATSLLLLKHESRSQVGYANVRSCE
jgi:putative MATE family efflux protein